MSIPSLANAEAFSPDSRVWVYVSNRPLTAEETAFVQHSLDTFCREWTAHNHALKARAEVFEGQAIILMVDETQAGASGCSIDKSVHFLEALGQEIGADFFERMRFGWVDSEGKWQFAYKLVFAQLVQNGHISPDTLVADTLVQTRQQLMEKWLTAFGESWHKRLV